MVVTARGWSFAPGIMRQGTWFSGMNRDNKKARAYKAQMRACALSWILGLARGALPAAVLFVVSGCDGNSPRAQLPGHSSTTCIGISMDCFAMTFFEPDSSALSSQTLNTLNKFVTECRRLQEGPIVITGHTDSSGTPEGKMAVSRARAEAVRAYLITIGMPAEPLKVEAYGSARPLVVPTERHPVLDESDHAQNRRVEVQVR
jgi:outer membrane protein OmpA-like peptidoglycan-associated protein